jgi:putative phosphoribosyl transferase
MIGFEGGGMQFDNRREAGRWLAERVGQLGLEDPVVLGLPRGGVPVAAEVAAALDAPLDVIVVRKVGAPHNPEFGVGAVGEEGVLLLNEDALSMLGVTRGDLDETIRREREELDRRLERYRSGRPPVPLEERTAVVVDDGLATGVSATAAGRVVRERQVRRSVLAVPVGAPDSIDRLRPEYDEVVALHAPAAFRAVGMWYREFGQTSDDTVVELLSQRYEREDERG